MQYRKHRYFSLMSIFPCRPWYRQYRIFGIGVGPTLINTKLMVHEEFYAVSLILLLYTAHGTQRNEYATTGKVCWSKCKIHAISITIFSKLKARAKWILLP